MARRKHKRRARPVAPDPEDLFFKLPTSAEDSLGVIEETSEHARHVSETALRSNRSRFLPMVKIVVTACGVLIFAGGIRSAVARSHRDDGWAKNPLRIAHREVSASPPTPPILAASAIAPASSARSDSAVDVRASRAKADESQMKLEHGAVNASIELGEDAVKLDPTSARAWLVLGAAYQQRGDRKNAWRCYHACVDQGQGKDRAECASML